MSERDVRVGMEVFGCGGHFLGRVDRLEGRLIRLDTTGGWQGQAHFVPLGWVEVVDDAVHLDAEPRRARSAARRAAAL